MRMQLQWGPPAEAGDRQEKERRCYDFLERLGVAYQRIDHQAAMTMEDCARIDEALDATICKNLLLCNRQRTAFYLLMIVGKKQFKTSTFSKQIGSSRLSFAAPEDMERLLDITPGSLSVLGLMNDRENRVKLFIDEDILKGAFFGCHPCVNTASLRLRTQDLLQTLLPAMGHTAQIVTLE